MENVAQKGNKPQIAARTSMFWAERPDAALKNCIAARCRPLFMPELVEEKINASANDSKDSGILAKWLTTPSIKATGRTKQGTPIVIYAHIPNYFSNPANITRAMRRGLIDRAGILPKQEFYDLIKFEGLKDPTGNTLVSIVDYNAFKAWKSDRFHLDEALEHPQTIPFLGSEKKAKRYLLDVVVGVYGVDRIGIYHKDDLNDEPVARLLYLFGNRNGYCDGGLFGDAGFDGGGQFVGVYGENKGRQ